MGIKNPGNIALLLSAQEKLKMKEKTQQTCIYLFLI